MKKVLFVVLLLFMAIIFTGCSNKKVKVDEKITGNCKVTDCINQIGVKDSLEKVNEVMGFDGELVKEEDNYKEYKWDVTNSSNVKVTFYDTGKDDIVITFDKSIVANENIDLSKFDEIKELVKTGNMDYATFNEKVGGVEGTLVQKSFYSKKYLWYNSSTKYLYGTFSEITSKCTLVTGYNN